MCVRVSADNWSSRLQPSLYIGNRAGHLALSLAYGQSKSAHLTEVVVLPCALPSLPSQPSLPPSRRLAALPCDPCMPPRLHNPSPLPLSTPRLRPTRWCRSRTRAGYGSYRYAYQSIWHILGDTTICQLSRPHMLTPGTQKRLNTHASCPAGARSGAAGCCRILR